MKMEARTQLHAVAADTEMRRLPAPVTVLLLLAVGGLLPALAWAQPPGGSSTNVTYYATYKLSGGTATQSDQTYAASATDTSAVWVTNSGKLTLVNPTITTTGNTSSADNSSKYGLNGGVVTSAAGVVTITGGSITTGGSVSTSGSKSPAIYSTGVITVSGAKLTATGGDGAVIDGANTIALTDTSLLGKKCGVKVHRTAPSSGSAIVTINGGSLTATAGEAFLFVAESGSLTAAVTVEGGAVVSTSTGCLVNATSASTVTLTADGETLAGSLIADNTSAIAATLKNGTTLTGTITKAALTIDSTSTWVVPATSTLTKLTATGTISLRSLGNTITVTGAASLGGRLVVDLGSAIAAPGVHTLISAGAVSGTFSSLDFSNGLPSNLAATLDYSATAVTLTIAQTVATTCFPYPAGVVTTVSLSSSSLSQ
jgi:hypothetical protein